MGERPAIDQGVIDGMLAQLHDPRLYRRFLLKPSPQASAGKRGIDFYCYSDFVRALVIGAEMFRESVGALPDIVRPQSFNEHIFYRKFFAVHPLPSLSNKLYARDYIARKVGGTLLAEVPWAGKSVESLWTAAIAPGKYFLKSNHASGFNLLVVAPDDLYHGRDVIRATTEQWLASRYNFLGGEWQYSTFAPAVFLEKYIEFESGVVPDEYNFYCFNGRVRFISFFREYPEDSEWAIYDPRWVPYGISMDGYRLPRHPSNRPANLDRMNTLAATLAQDFDFVRVDFYSDGRDRAYCGELTFTPFDGRAKFSDPAADRRLGAFFNELAC